MRRKRFFRRRQKRGGNRVRAECRRKMLQYGKHPRNRPHSENCRAFGQNRARLPARQSRCRCKTHPYISTGLKANKFGIAYADALEAYRHAAQQPNLKIIGIDCHIGSQLTDLSPLVEACERILILVDALAAEGIVLEHLDLGGGVGIVYKDEGVPDLGAYARAVQN